ncbi:MAG: phosphoadenylyl-sulfate reductase [Deltaproteobacteria bacterium]|nr:phosphoadenylyl-sulfate reductase [Deltaproteobacteria bacterium]
MINQNLIKELQDVVEPGDLIAEIVRRFGNRAAIGTSGQLTGVAMIDMAFRAGVKPRVFTIDTLRLFPETYELFEKLEKKYDISIEKIQPDSKKLKAMIKEHGEYLFFDSKEKQELCCHLRKVEPNEKVLGTLDVWITGLRADQSSHRAKTPKFQIIEQGQDKRPLLKVAPLIDWKEKDLRDYLAKYQVPIHSLLAWNQDGWYYESLGCILCTTPIGPYESRRAGRWRWFNNEEDNKECGLHS